VPTDTHRERSYGLERLRLVAAKLTERYPPEAVVERELTGSESLRAYVDKLEAKYLPERRPELRLVQGGRDDA